MLARKSNTTQGQHFAREISCSRSVQEPDSTQSMDPAEDSPGRDHFIKILYELIPQKMKTP
jgi:hypothetical protein